MAPGVISCARRNSCVEDYTVAATNVTIALVQPLTSERLRNTWLHNRLPSNPRKCTFAAAPGRKRLHRGWLVCNQNTERLPVDRDSIEQLTAKIDVLTTVMAAQIGADLPLIERVP